ncbi:beta strand repeat-containing protein, partial [Mesorhizobium australafricanum]
AYGTLTLNANGSYSYHSFANQVPAGGATDTFVYTIKDGDGDTSTTTLTINLTDSGLAATNDDAKVNEAALPTGSNPSSTAETVTGTLADNVSGGVGTLTFALVGSGTGSHGTLTLNPDGTYSYTLTSPVHGPATQGTDVVNNVETFTYQATDANGNTVTNTITIDVTDDVPHAIAPDTAVLLNTAGTAFTGKLDFDGNVDNNYGADGGDTRFAASLNGTDSGFTSGGRHILYSVSQDGHTLTGFLDANGDSTYTVGTDAAVFTVALNLDHSFASANDTYTVNLIGTVDGGAQTIDFSNGSAYNFVGGNGPWVGYIDKSSADHDLLVTPLSVNGGTVSSGGTVNGTANALGVSGGASVGSGEGVRLDYVTGLAGSPGSSGDYGTQARQNETYTGHYDVNGATVSFGLNGSNSTSVELSAYVDSGSDSNPANGSVTANIGTPDSVSAVAIQYNNANTVFSYAGHALNTFYVVSVGGHNFTVEFVNTSGTIHAVVGGIVDGTTLGLYGATNYSALQVDYYATNHISTNGTSVTGTPASDTFQITGFGATSITPGQPVDMHLPVNLVDGDGDVANGTIGVYLMPSSPTTADHSADSSIASHAYTATSSQPDVIGSNYDDSISAAGLSGNHILYGGLGNDTLVGGTGTDTLIGGDGNDTLVAGTGNNTMIGGAGADTFVINAATWTSHGSIHDLIADYHPGEGDTVDLSKVLDAVFGGSQTLADTSSSVSATNDGTNVHINVTHGGSTVEVATLTANTGISHTINIVYDDAHHATTVNVP